MTTSYTLTGDIASLLGGSLKAPRHVKVTLSTNLGDVALVDLDANEVRLSGTTRVDLTDDLTFSLSLIATNSTGTNVTDGTLRYKVDAIYRDANNREREWSSGYFALTADADLSDKAGGAGDLDVTVAPSPSLIDSPQAANISSTTSATRTALNGLYVGPAAVVKAGDSADLVTKVNNTTTGEVFIPRGTYNPTATLNPQAGVTLRGEGEKTIIQLPNAGNRNVIEILSGANDVTIRDLMVDGNRANQTANSNAIKTIAARTRVIDCHVKSANGYNIVAFPGASDFMVEGCVSEDARDEGIEFQGCVRGAAVGNTVRGAGKNGIYVYANTTSNPANTVSDITIGGNVVEGSSALSSGYCGIRVDDGAENVTVTGNVVVGGAGAGNVGIGAFSSTAVPVTDVTISGNSVRDTASYGIDLGDSKVSAIGNTVSGAVTVGIRSSSDMATIADNTVISVTGTGIQVSSGTTDVAVNGNAVNGCTAQGIYLVSAVRPAVVGNTVRDCGGTTAAGIHLSSNSQPTVTGNTVHGSGTQGIFAQDSTGVTVTGNTCSNSRNSGIMIRNTTDFTVSGNVCKNNGQDATDTSFGNGITLFNSSGTVDKGVVAHNRCFDDQGTKTQDYGIRTHNTIGSSVSIGPNILDGNGTSGMVFSSPGATGPSCVPWKLLSNISVSSTGNSIAHGLPYVPQTVLVYMRSAGTIWRGGGSDASTVVLISDSGTRTCDVLVG